MEENGSTVEQAVKRARRQSYTCKRKGNQRQLDHAVQVLDRFDEASVALKGKSYDNVKDVLDAGSLSSASGQPNRRAFSSSQRLGPCFKISSFFTFHVRLALFLLSDSWGYSRAIFNILQDLLAFSFLVYLLTSGKCRMQKYLRYAV